jgi:aspartate-semialdehyde dehydrogenase
MLNILAEREFPIDEIAAVASPRSQGDIIDFGETGKTLKVQSIEHFDFTGWDIALFAAGSGPTKIYAPKAAAAGCVVIDNPNCSTAQMVVALKPLHDEAGITRVVVSTYQSVSGAGKEGMDELFSQTRAIFVGEDKEAKKFTKQIAFNVIPHIDVFVGPETDYDGYTKEELKMALETNKILSPDIGVTATCVRVPVFVGHSEAITVEFERPITVAKAQSILREAPGVMLVDKREDGGYVTPVECVGDYATFISRVRKDPTVQNGLNLWCVSDNLRKGAALNAVQIAELLGRRHLKKA